MKGLFIPGITAEMLRNGCLESVEALMSEGEMYDIEFSEWIPLTREKPTGKEYLAMKGGKLCYISADLNKADWVSEPDTMQQA